MITNTEPFENLDILTVFICLTYNTSHLIVIFLWQDANSIYTHTV